MMVAKKVIFIDLSIGIYKVLILNLQQLRKWYHIHQLNQQLETNFNVDFGEKIYSTGGSVLRTCTCNAEWGWKFFVHSSLKLGLWLLVASNWVYTSIIHFLKHKATNQWKEKRLVRPVSLKCLKGRIGQPLDLHKLFYTHSPLLSDLSVKETGLSWKTRFLSQTSNCRPSNLYIHLSLPSGSLILLYIPYLRFFLKYKAYSAKASLIYKYIFYFCSPIHKEKLNSSSGYFGHQAISECANIVLLDKEF